MDKLVTAVFVVMTVAGVGAEVPVGQEPGPQPLAAFSAASVPLPQTQPPPQTPPPPKTTAKPPAQGTAPPKPAGQAPPQAPPPASKPAQSSGTPGGARTSAWLFVTTLAGSPIVDARVTLTGPVEREGTTSREGAVRFTGLRAGTYRARFDAADYVLFEKEWTVRAGQALEAEVALNAAPVKKVEAPPPPPPPPPKPVEAPPGPAGEVSALSLPDWIEKNMIGRTEPQKLSAIGRAPGLAAAILQVRETVEDRSNPDADEMLYVIAGEGSAKLGDRTQAVSAGWFVVVPRDTEYTLERRGRNPLILLSIVAPARAAGSPPR